MAAPSFDDLFNIGKAEMLIRRPDLFLAPGDTTDFLVAAGAAMADKNIQFAAEEFRKTFIDGATGDDLTTLVDDHFAIQRNPATAAQGTVEFTRPTAGAGAGTILAGTTISTIEDETGERQEFTTDADAVFGGAALGPIAVAATAVDAGRDGNVGAVKVLNIVDAVFDGSIVVSNPLAFAGGNNEESDDQLRERARDFPSTLRRGTLAALEFGALTVPAVRVATATEDALGVVTLFVTDELGGSTAQMVNDVLLEIENWRCAGSIVTVTGGSVLTQAISITLILTGGTSVATITASVQAAITERLEKLPVGDGTASSEGVLRTEIIQAAAISVDPDNIIGVDVITPAADVVPAVAQVIRAGAISVS
jgi:uncharacterized phage protein gp47/JayE